MKVLFLDFDGVLNHQEFLAEDEGDILLQAEGWYGAHRIDPQKVKLLNQICFFGACNVVFSTSWRQQFETIELWEMLHQHGFTGSVVGSTPRKFQPEPGGRYSTRGEEIEKWLNWTTMVTGFAVLDDDKVELSGEDQKRFVQTSMVTGLEGVHAERAVEAVRTLWRVGDGTDWVA